MDKSDGAGRQEWMGRVSDRLEEHGIPPLVASYFASLTLMLGPDDDEGNQGEVAEFAEWLGGFDA